MNSNGRSIAQAVSEISCTCPLRLYYTFFLFNELFFYFRRTIYNFNIELFTFPKKYIDVQSFKQMSNFSKLNKKFIFTVIIFSRLLKLKTDVQKSSPYASVYCNTFRIIISTTTVHCCRSSSRYPRKSDFVSRFLPKPSQSSLCLRIAQFYLRSL